MESKELKESMDPKEVPAPPKASVKDQSPARAKPARVTKPKNPQRVSQGQRLADHNKKMKLQLVKMSESSNGSSNAPLKEGLPWLKLTAVAVVGIAVYILTRRSPETEPETEPPFTIESETPGVLDME